MALGQDQRATTIEAAGLTLMGARVYGAPRGAFSSADPLLYGNNTSYVYSGDPINESDVTGRITVSGGKPNAAERRLCAKWWWSCLVWARVSSDAYGWSTAKYGNNTNKREAARHIFWQAMLVLQLGFEWALSWATAHEGNDLSRDSVRDQANNIIGRRLGLSLGWFWAIQSYYIQVMQVRYRVARIIASGNYAKLYTGKLR